MVSFLTLYFLVYGGMHAYFCWRVRQAFADAPGLWLWAGVVVWSALTVCAPIAMHRLEGSGHIGAARAAAWIGYLWMAWVFWMLMLGVTIDVWNAAVRLAALGRPALERMALAPRPALWAICTVIALASVWGFAEAARVRLRTIRIALPGLPAGARPVRLVQISDLHLGLTVRQGLLEKVTRLVAEARPDVVVSTGDLVDASFYLLEGEVALLAAVEAPLGKFAVTGNHEFYPGLPGTLAFHDAAGFRMLRQDAVRIAPGLVLAGVDDPTGKQMGGESLTDERAALAVAARIGSEANGAGTENSADESTSRASSPPSVILLKHRPDLSPALTERPALQLSGHIHGGQIFPFGLFVHLQHRYGPGLHPVGNEETSRLGSGTGSADAATPPLLYVSRGTGTWGPPLRVLAPPEVTLFILEPARQ